MALPSIRQLQFLIALAEEESFTLAAKRCNVTQPTLSTAIRETERGLGVQLVEREKRGVVLTEAGKIAVARAKIVVAELEELALNVVKTGEPLTGSFRLGAIPTIAPFIFPQLTGILKQNYPKLNLFLSEDKTDNLTEFLRNRAIDAALLALPWKTPGIEIETLFDDEFLLVAPINHDLLSKKSLSANDLRPKDMLLLEDGHCLRHHVLSICSLHNTRHNASLAATSLLTLVQMVSNGLGVSMLPKIAVDTGFADRSGVDVRAFNSPLIGRSVGIAWRAGSFRSKEARIIGEIINSVVS